MGEGVITVASLWQEATEAKREAVWKALPEEIWHEVKVVTAEDVEFLIDTSALSENILEAHSAYRALGIIGEDQLEHRPRVLHYLLRSLSSVSNYRRHWAAEAIWQIDENSEEVRKALAEAIEVETHPEVKKTMEHVLLVINHL